jgi:hypothetical protein
VILGLKVNVSLKSFAFFTFSLGDSTKAGRLSQSTCDIFFFSLPRTFLASSLEASLIVGVKF